MRRANDARASPTVANEYVSPPEELPPLTAGQTIVYLPRSVTVPPIVYLNGVKLAEANVSLFSSTQIELSLDFPVEIGSIVTVQFILSPPNPASFAPPGAAPFLWSEWAALYPELVAQGATEAFATAQFGVAGLYLDNSACSPVSDLTQRRMLLYMVTAHLVAMSPAAGGSGLVGRVSGATEGSVSVQTQWSGATGTESWFLQTTYGANFWAATAALRSMIYEPGPQPYLGTGIYGASVNEWGSPRWLP